MVNDKFWNSLTTKTRNTLRRHNILSPWDMTVKELMRVPGIGPQTVAEIAALTEKFCL